MIVKTYKNGNVHIKLEKDELHGPKINNVYAFSRALNRNVDKYSWYGVSGIGVFDIEWYNSVFLDITERVYSLDIRDYNEILKSGKTLILSGEKPNDIQIKMLKDRYNINFIDGKFYYSLPF